MCQTWDTICAPHNSDVYAPQYVRYVRHACASCAALRCATTINHALPQDNRTQPDNTRERERDRAKQEKLIERGRLVWGERKSFNLGGHSESRKQTILIRPYRLGKSRTQKAIIFSELYTAGLSFLNSGVAGAGWRPRPLPCRTSSLRAATVVLHLVHRPHSTLYVLHAHKALMQGEVVSHSVLSTEKQKKK